MSKTPEEQILLFLPPPPPTSTPVPSDDPAFVEKEEIYDDVIGTVVIRYSQEILEQLNIQQCTKMN